MKTRLLFDYFPYAAAALFVAASLGRIILSSRANRPVAGPLLVDPAAWIRRAVWGLLLASHGAIIALPALVVACAAHPAGLYAFEGASFVVGLSALASWFRSARRHFKLRGSLRGELADSVFLSFLGTGLASGLAMAVQYRWASTWGAATLTPYVLSVASGAPRVTYVASMPLLVKLHVFTATAALAASPFTTPAGLLARRIAAAWRRVAPSTRVGSETPASIGQ